MLVRIAALVAVDVPSFSYLLNLEVASELESTPSASAAPWPQSRRLSAHRGSHPLPENRRGARFEIESQSSRSLATIWRTTR